MSMMSFSAVILWITSFLLSGVRAMSDIDLNDADSMVLNMLQLQVHTPRARAVSDSISQSYGQLMNESIAAIAADLESPHLQPNNSKATHQLQPTSTFSRQLEQEGASRSLLDGVSMIVPGLGNESRAELVKQNIRWLKSQGVPFECRIYVYLSDSEFPLESEGFAPCQLIRHPGFWTDHLSALDLNQTRYRWVLHLMDSVEPGKNVRLNKMIDVMKKNNLSHAAPTFLHYDQYYVMESRHQPPGRKVGFIEMNMDVFSREHYACLQDHLRDHKNRMGWGLDMAVPVFCQGQMGVFDEMNMVKKYRGAYDYSVAAESMLEYVRDLKTKHVGIKLVNPWKPEIGLLQGV